MLKIQCTLQYKLSSFLLQYFSEIEFLDVIGTKFSRVFLFAIHSQLYKKRVLPPPPPPLPFSNSDLKLVYNLNIEYGNLKPETSPDYAQKQRKLYVYEFGFRRHFFHVFSKKKSFALKVLTDHSN
jgi:hypothetical protein